MWLDKKIFIPAEKARKKRAWKKKYGDKSVEDIYRQMREKD